MLGLVHNFFAPPTHPIGIDVDGRTLRMAQVQSAGAEFRLRGAACKRWPAQALGLDAGTVRDALRECGFVGRDVVLALPATAVSGLDEQIEPSQKQKITDILEVLGGVGLRVHAVRPLPMLLCGLVGQLFRRDGETNCTTLHIHLSESTTLCSIVVAGVLKSVSTFDFSRQTVLRALAGKLGGSLQEADALRERLLHAAAAVDWQFDRTLIHRPAAGQLGHPLNACGDESSRLCEESAALQAVVAAEVGPLTQHLHQLRNTFNQPIDRLIFTGSEAMNRPLCEGIARALALPAHVADPILRMRNGHSRELAGGIDRRLPQPAWAAAIGASLGAHLAVTR